MEWLPERVREFPVATAIPSLLFATIDAEKWYLRKVRRLSQRSVLGLHVNARLLFHLSWRKADLESRTGSTGRLGTVVRRGGWRQTGWGCRVSGQYSKD